MPQETNRRLSRHSSQSTQIRSNSRTNEDGNGRNRQNRDIRERGFYSELATIDPDSRFQVKRKTNLKKFSKSNFVVNH